jgi:hypothetical protein
MKYELYEVWGTDSNGHEQLIDTTHSLKEAQTMARTALSNALLDNITECKIYRDVDGELELIAELPL